MKEFRKLLNEVLDLVEQKEAIIEKENVIRKQIRDYMIENNIKQTQTMYHDFILSKSTIVDEVNLHEEHPDIYYLGIEQKFSIEKLRGKIPNKMIDDIVRKHGKGEEYHVKIRRRSNKGYFGTPRRPNKKIQEG